MASFMGTAAIVVLVLWAIAKARNLTRGTAARSQAAARSTGTGLKKLVAAVVVVGMIFSAVIFGSAVYSWWHHANGAHRVAVAVLAILVLAAAGVGILRINRKVTQWDPRK